MPNVLIPLLAGTLSEGECFGTEQERLNAYAAAMQGVLPGLAYYNYGNTKPAVQYQSYPWLNTNDGRWYSFSGNWKSPVNYSLSDRRLYLGSEASLATYDGGDTTFGAMWVVDHDFDGRVPMGPGVVPGSDPSKTLTFGEQYGAGSHTLTEAEGAVGNHKHFFGKTNPASDDAYFGYQGGSSTVQSYSGFFVTGSNGQIISTQTTADLITSPAGAGGAGVVSTPFSVVPPVVGCFVIKWTGRVNYIVP